MSAYTDQQQADGGRVPHPETLRTLNAAYEAEITAAERAEANAIMAGLSGTPRPPRQERRRLRDRIAPDSRWQDDEPMSARCLAVLIAASFLCGAFTVALAVRLVGCAA